MSLEKIKEAVLKASRTEAEYINSAAEKQAKERLELKKENLRREFEYQFQARSRLIEEEYSRRLANFQGTSAKEFLEAKNATLRAIFDRARQKVLSWAPDEYGRMMKGFLEKVSAGRRGQIRIHHDDTKVFRGLIEDINGGRDEASRIEIDEGTLHDRGGFIFISDDFEVDATLGTILGDIEQSLLPQMAQDLAHI